MTEEPYRWLDAIANRREYVQAQLKGGSPVFAASLAEGLLVLGVGAGHSKVFEIFDRQALAGLGHPADLERIRQAIIDAAHLEAFARAPEDVSLRRLVSFGLGPQLKTAFEQIFSPPYLLRLLLVEVGARPEADVIIRLNFDGSFEVRAGGVVVVTDERDGEAPTDAWLAGHLSPDATVKTAAPVLLEAWWHLTTGRPLAEAPGDSAAVAAALEGRVLEAALLRRRSDRPARFVPLDPTQLGLTPAPSSSSSRQSPQPPPQP